LLPSHTSGSYFLSTTRSFIGMIALSVILMPSGQTSVQHFVMLHIPIPAAPWASSGRSWVSSGCMSSSAYLRNIRGPAGLFPSWSRTAWQYQDALDHHLDPDVTLAGPAADALREHRLDPDAVSWLQTNFLKTELELGHCLRTPGEGPCECDLVLTCSKFLTTSSERTPRPTTSWLRRSPAQLEPVAGTVPSSSPRPAACSFGAGRTDTSVDVSPLAGEEGRRRPG